MPADLDRTLDRLLAEYNPVEPTAAQVRTWLEQAQRPMPRPRRTWLLSPPAWAAVALLLLLIFGMAWLRVRNRNPTRPTLATEHSVLVPASSNAPLTDEQKQLIQILQSNPKALATLKPGQLQPPPQKPGAQKKEKP
ncbi:MAG: hypothetical protein ACRD1E_12780 [Terriglobales bacterium]